MHHDSCQLRERRCPVSVHRLLRTGRLLATRYPVQRILYRTPTPEALEELFGSAATSSDPDGEGECELPLGEAAEPVTLGAWVLAVFETTRPSDAPPLSVSPASRPPASSRATCAPARIVDRPDGALALRFSPADWQRIASYARVRRESTTPGHTSERIRSARPVTMPSVFPAAPLPQVETMCIMHWVEDEAIGTRLAEALGAPCHAFTAHDDVVRFATEQKAAGQRIDAFVFGLPADDDLSALVKQMREAHPGAVILCLMSGARAQIMRALYEAGADELLQAQTAPSEVAVTLLALVRRRSAKATDALGAA